MTPEYRERIAKVKKLRDQGVDREDIAARFGVTVANVDKMIGKAREEEARAR